MREVQPLPTRWRSFNCLMCVQKESPGADKESNWLPAPNDLIYLVMRLYWPKAPPPSILPPGEGTWKPPAIQVAK
jgi:hypothetical protein